MRKYIIPIIAAMTTMLMISCNDMHDVPREPIWSDTTEVTSMLVLSEGLFNMNNSTLANINLATGEIDYDYFNTINKRGLGDTANDMEKYGSKIYIVVNVSSQLEVIDAKSGKSLKQIPMFNEEGIARQPRYITFRDGKGYMCCFDGWVARIDTTSLEVDGLVKCGRNPDGVAIANNKLYVTNSGGLDNPNYDTTVSVIDLETFKEIKKIEVDINMGPIAADSEGDIYVVSRGDYEDDGYQLHKIDTEIDEKIETFEGICPLNLIIFDDKAYMYSYDFTTQERWIKVFDCLTDEIIREQFIIDGTEIQTPYGMTINPDNGDLYIMDACSFILWGDIYCFNNKGKLKFRLKEIGLNPNSIVFN